MGYFEGGADGFSDLVCVIGVALFRDGENYGEGRFGGERGFGVAMLMLRCVVASEW